MPPPPFVRVNVRPAVLLAPLAGLLFPSLGRAAEPRLSTLAVDAGATRDCPDARELVDAVNRESATPRAVPSDGADADVVVTLSQVAGRYHATVRTRDGSREIEDDGPGCGALSDGVALAISILLRPREVAPRPAAPPPPAPAPSWHGEATVRGGATNLTGDLAPLVEAGARIWPRRWLSVGGGFLGVAPATTDYGPGSIGVSLLAATLDACAALEHEASKLAAAACVRAGLGSLRGFGEGFFTNRTGAVPWTAIAGEVGARGPIVGPVRWEASLGLWALVGDARFTVDVDGGQEKVFRAARLAPYGTLGVSVRFF